MNFSVPNGNFLFVFTRLCAYFLVCSLVCDLDVTVSSHRCGLSFYMNMPVLPLLILKEDDLEIFRLRQKQSQLLAVLVTIPVAVLETEVFEAA